MVRIFFLFIILPEIFIGCDSKPATSIPYSDSSPVNQQKIHWHWEDDFSIDEQEKMKQWITIVSDCAQKVLGRYPFDLHYHFHRENNSDHAVVFGHTARTFTYHATHFYVNPVFPIEDFIADWMAPHEISHLALPKLKKENMWFYEGFATYMSRKVMTEMGTITELEADSTATAKIRFIKDYYTGNSNFVFVADSLGSSHNYPALYWGGGSYFHKIDRKLKAENKISLVNVLKYFQMWAHEPDLNLDEVITAFDKISQSTIFSKLSLDYTTKPAKEILTEY